MAAATVEGLPEEVLGLILSKLPVKSVLRFKCVQKSWYSLINSPYFIHLHRSSSSSNQCFIVRRFNLRGHVLSFHSYETLDDLGPQITLPFPNLSGAFLSGSCDGLIVCMTNLVDHIILCNPVIPGFRFLVFPPPLGNRSRYHIDSVAFGSDPNTGQHKVLMVGAAFDYGYLPYYGDEYDDCVAWLYDLSADTWRKTAAVIPPGPFRYNHCAVSLNGAFHWCPGDKSSNILTFHMTNEVTGSIPLPDFVLVNVFCEQKRVFVSSKSQLSLVLYDSGREESLRFA